MIAPMRTTVNPSSTQTVPSFESFLPTLKIQFRKAAAALPSWADRADAVAEMVGIAYRNYASLVRRGRTDIYPTPLGDFAVKSYFSGRRVAGMSATDATSDRCQLLERAVVLTNTGMDDYYCREHQTPALLACFKIDFEAWEKSLGAKKRDILHSFLYGYTTNEISAQFKVSPGRVSQLRRELIDAWYEFTAERTTDDEEEA